MERQDRAVVLHHSRCGRTRQPCYELVRSRQAVVWPDSFLPGNAIAVRATQALATNEWSQVVVTYDGSSRADGLRLYRMARWLATEVIRDNLCTRTSRIASSGRRGSGQHSPYARRAFP